MTFRGSVTVPLMKDVKNQLPQAICELAPGNVARNLLVNRDVPPFDNPEMRRAMALSLDRKAFIDIVTEGQGNVGGIMQPPPEGIWGLPPEILQTLPGYGPDVAKNREEARAIMRKLGYGPNKRLSVKMPMRDVAPYRDTAVILVDQLKEIYFDAEIEPVDTTQWFPKADAPGLSVRSSLTWQWARRPRQQFLYWLHLRRRGELQRLLQPGS